jgi:tryptophan 2,3-dioxygenase
LMLHELRAAVAAIAADQLPPAFKMLARAYQTGGTSGVGYLCQMLDVVLFPEIWAVRTEL